MSTLSPRRLLSGIVAIVTLAACGSDAPTAAVSVTGAYSLSTVNGKSLPATLTQTVDGMTAQITFSQPTSLTLNSDNSFRTIGTIKIVFGTVVEQFTDTGTGKYVLNGQQVTLTPTGDAPFTASWNGSDMLTIQDSGDVFVFRK